MIEPGIDIDSLLNSSTFQGMSDEEIQAIIDYKLNERERVLRCEFELEKQNMEHSDLYACTLAAAERADANFKKALELHDIYQNVTVI